MAALLGEPGVVDDPRLDRFVPRDGWQHTVAHTAQHRPIRPRRLRHKVQQRLVLRRSALRRGHRRQRFDTLATLRRQQSDTVVREWPDLVGMAEHRCQTCCVILEPRSRAGCIVETHPTLPGRLEFPPPLTNHSRVAPSGKCQITSQFCELRGLEAKQYSLVDRGQARETQ